MASSKLYHYFTAIIILLFMLSRMGNLQKANYDRYYHKPYFPARSPLYMVYNPKSPQLLFDEYFSTYQSILALTNMSAELYKDAELKIRYLNILQVGFQDNKHYSAGTVAAGIMERYSHLLSIYKFYSNKVWLHTKRYVEILHAYQIMQSEYNEYRIERDLFNDIVNDKYKQPNRSSQDGEDIKPILTIADWNKLSPEGKQKFIASQKAKGWNDESGRRITGSQQDLKFNTIDEEIKTVRRLEREYKKKLRYNKWSQKWQGFDPDVEGIAVDDKLVKAGFEKAGDFKGLNAF